MKRAGECLLSNGYFYFWSTELRKGANTATQYIFAMSRTTSGLNKLSENIFATLTASVKASTSCSSFASKRAWKRNRTNTITSSIYKDVHSEGAAGAITHRYYLSTDVIL